MLQQWADEAAERAERGEVSTPVTPQVDPASNVSLPRTRSGRSVRKPDKYDPDKYDQLRQEHLDMEKAKRLSLGGQDIASRSTRSQSAPGTSRRAAPPEAVVEDPPTPDLEPDAQEEDAHQEAEPGIGLQEEF